LLSLLARPGYASGRDRHPRSRSSLQYLDIKLLYKAGVAAPAYRDAGADLIIVSLPRHPKPDSLQPPAEALGPLA